MRKLLFFLFVLGGFCSSASASTTLTLDNCLQLARQNNPQLVAAASNPRLAATATRQARSVYLPHVDLNAGYTSQQAAQQVNMGAISAPTQERDYPHASIGVNQLLYDFGRSGGQLGAADANLRAADASYAAQEQDILLRTAAAFYRVLTAKAILRAAEEEVMQTEAHLHTAQSLYDQGVVTRNDLLQAKVKLAASRQQVLARQGEENNAWLELNYLCALPPHERSTLISEENTGVALISSDISNRPDIRAQQELVTSAQAKIRQAKGEFWPQLYAHLGADYVDNRYVEEDTIYSATLGLKMTIYDGSARNAQLSRAQEACAQQQHHLAEMQQRAQLDERTARNDAEVAAQKIAVAQSAIEMAQENLRINQGRYQAQVGTATEVLDAETLLTQSKTDLARARFDYQLALARVRHAVGAL